MAKKNRIKDAFLEELCKIPIVAVACEKVNISRNSVYTWRKEDEGFRQEMEAALAEGEALVTDMSESQLLSLIQEKNFPSIQLWLKTHHPKYSNKVEVTATIKENTELSLEQRALVNEALRLADLPVPEESAPSNDPKPTQPVEPTEGLLG